MKKIITIGLDLAKSVFQIHGAPHLNRSVRADASMPTRHGDCLEK